MHPSGNQHIRQLSHAQMFALCEQLKSTYGDRVMLSLEEIATAMTARTKVPYTENNIRRALKIVGIKRFSPPRKNAGSAKSPPYKLRALARIVHRLMVSIREQGFNVPEEDLRKVQLLANSVAFEEAADPSNPAD